MDLKRSGFLIIVFFWWGVIGKAAAEWQNVGPFLGNVTCFTCDQSHPDRMFAGTSGGGVWLSEDGGKNWRLTAPELTRRTVEWLRIHPAQPNIMYAGIKTAGLWASTDRGQTWAFKQLSRYGSSDLALDLVFSPRDPKKAVIPGVNLHYRTSDGGKTWHDFRLPDMDVLCFAYHPDQANKLFAGGVGQNFNLRFSSDGGKTWAPLGQNLLEASRIFQLLIDPAEPQKMYARGYKGLYKSVDGGANWTKLETGVRSGRDIFSVTLDQAQPQILYATTKRGLIKSSDGGETWQDADRGLGNYLAKAIFIHPQNSALLFAGSSATGIYKSSDGGQNWKLSTTGLACGWIEKVYPYPHTPGALFAQTTIGLFQRDQSGTWTEIREPFSKNKKAQLDGIFFDRVSPKKVFAFAISKYWISENEGRSWTEAKRKERAFSFKSGPEYKSLVQDPADPKILYAGCWSSTMRKPGEMIFKSTDGGWKWKAAGNGVPLEAITLLLSPAAETVIALNDEAHIFRTSDGGQNWSDISSGLAVRQINDLALNPANPEHIFLAAKEGLFQSTDGGKSWFESGLGLKDKEIKAVVFSPTPNGSVFVATFNGVFRSSDDGKSWQEFNDGLTLSDVECLAFDRETPPTLYAGTDGGSVFSVHVP